MEDLMFHVSSLKLLSQFKSHDLVYWESPFQKEDMKRQVLTSIKLLYLASLMLRYILM